MKFMLHTILDAPGNVLRVHYKNTKCDASFSQGSLSTIIRWGGNYAYMGKKVSSCSQQCKHCNNVSIFWRHSQYSVLSFRLQSL